MINLLPEDNKRLMRAARANVVLLRYNLFTLIAVVVLCLICVLFWAMLHNTQSTALSKSTTNSEKAATYAETRKQADEYRANLAIASQILSNGVNYTDTIFTITKLLPSGVVLDSLTVNATDFGKQMTFSAHAKTFDKATELKKNFQNSTAFSNVYLQNISDSSDGGGSGSSAEYPVAIALSAKLNEAVKK